MNAMEKYDEVKVLEKEANEAARKFNECVSKATSMGGNG